jgi:hypothetical protein
LAVEYLAIENRILKAQLKGQLKLWHTHFGGVVSFAKISQEMIFKSHMLP